MARGQSRELRKEGSGGLRAGEIQNADLCRSAFPNVFSSLLSKEIRPSNIQLTRYIYAENSRSQLLITRSSLAEVFTYHQVMPVYLDFMFVFGAQSDATDLRFGGFHQHVMMRDPPRGPSMPELGRSGRYFQLCYNLKGVTPKLKSDVNLKLDEWSIRQAAIYHQLDVVYGTTLWIVTKGTHRSSATL
ncbi:hypothetical protein AJ80_07104 [Polytolypa hystricis UAMH7299]|uniref:CorA-like transporter domain-containing protein n=1 Tax=Polytolypa hystricis (strain UAMH7299) TaxID=1447883 RepID=A0A2B7XQF5_POLH7|nr:hypothetical protein AJ80_07104 [Polytolypa hystricis UAMH7299]